MSESACVVCMCIPQVITQKEVTIVTNAVSHSLAEVTIHWTPTQDQSGDHVICIMAVDSLLASSTPYCIPMSVTDVVVEVSIN